MLQRILHESWIATNPSLHGSNNYIFVTRIQILILKQRDELIIIDEADPRVLYRQLVEILGYVPQNHLVHASRINCDIQYHPIKAETLWKKHIGNLIVLLSSENGAKKLRLESECPPGAHISNQVLHL